MDERDGRMHYNMDCSIFRCPSQILHRCDEEMMRRLLLRAYSGPILNGRIWEGDKGWD